MKLFKSLLVKNMSNWIGLLTIFLVFFAQTTIADEKICFPNHRGLPHHGNLPPTVDGYVGREFGISTSELEQGWNGSSLVGYGRGGSISDVEFRGIQDASQPFIYLSFVVRFDEAFDYRGFLAPKTAAAVFKLDGFVG